MKTKRRKTLCILLAFVMAAGFLPLGQTAHAADPVKLMAPVVYWNGDTVQWKGIDGADYYRVSFTELRTGGGGDTLQAIIDIRLNPDKSLMQALL